MGGNKFRFIKQKFASVIPVISAQNPFCNIFTIISGISKSGFFCTVILHEENRFENNRVFLINNINIIDSPIAPAVCINLFSISPGKNNIALICFGKIFNRRKILAIRRVMVFHLYKSSVFIAFDPFRN